MIRYSTHRGTLLVQHTPERCIVADHTGVASETVGGVLCRIHIAHAEPVLAAWWYAYAMRAKDDGEVRLLPGASEPPLAFRLVG